MAEPERDFAEFYASRFEPNRRMAYALCGDWTEAEELTQHAFVRVYAKWALVARGNAEGYLRTALTRLFLDTRRRGRGRERLVADTPERSGPDGTTRVEDQQSLPAALQEVSPGSAPRSCCGSCRTCPWSRSRRSSAARPGR